MEPFYRNILKQAWGLTWKHRWLWFFGFFATFLGNSTFYESIVRSYGHIAAGQSLFLTISEYANSGIFSTFTWEKIYGLWQADTLNFSVSMLVLFILLLVAAFVVIMAVVSQVALVKSAIALDERKKITFKEAFRIGVLKFWPVFFLNLITRVLMFGFLVLLAYLVSLVITNKTWLDFGIYLVAFLILLLAGIIIYFLTIYSTAFIVLRDKKLGASMKYAWYLFKTNVLLNIEMGLMMFLVNVVVGVVAVIIAIFAISPFVLAYLLFLLLGITSSVWILISFIFLILGVLFVFTGSWYTAFHVAVWSVLFEELALKRGKSKILRLIDHVKSKKKTLKGTKAKSRR